VRAMVETCMADSEADTNKDTMSKAMCHKAVASLDSTCINSCSKTFLLSLRQSFLLS
jgi:hypothetical protein